MVLYDKESVHQISLLFLYVCLTVHYVTSYTADFISAIKGLWQAASSYKI